MTVSGYTTLREQNRPHDMCRLAPPFRSLFQLLSLCRCSEFRTKPMSLFCRGTATEAEVLSFALRTAQDGHLQNCILAQLTVLYCSKCLLLSQALWSRACVRSVKD